MKLISYSDRIRQYRADNDMTQQELANKLGVSKQTISSWETDNSTPILKDVPSIAERLGVPIWWLYGFSNAPRTEDEKKIEEVINDSIKSSQDTQSAPKTEINVKQYPNLADKQVILKMQRDLKAMELLEAELITKEKFDELTKE